MTNEEAIEYLIDIPRSYGVRRDDAPCNAINIAINSIQENTKLKAEIEQLKYGSKIIAKELVTQIREIKQLKEVRNKYGLLLEMYDKKQKEIEQLKSELEQLKEIADMNNPCYQCVRYDQCGYQHSRCNSFESVKGQV